MMLRPTRDLPAPAGALSICLAALLSAAGCNSTDKAEPKEIEVLIRPPPESERLELELEYEWDGLKRDDQGRRDAYEVARWVTERHNAVLRCLNQDPPARTQALELLRDVLRKVPTSSRDRFLLARTLFAEAAYYFRAADATAWEIDRLRYEKTSRPDAQGRRRRLTDEEVEEVVRKAKPVLAEANEKLKAKARESLSAFGIYRQQRPDDKGVLDFLWKLHFYLQNYEEALRWLDFVLREMDAQEIPPEEPLRRDYADIRQKLEDYLATLRLEGRTGTDERGSSVLPWKDQRGRDVRRRIGTDDAR